MFSYIIYQNINNYNQFMNEYISKKSLSDFSDLVQTTEIYLNKLLKGSGYAAPCIVRSLYTNLAN